MMTPPKERRQELVDQINTELREKGFEPDEETQELQRRYIAGEIDAWDMADWVLAYVRKLQQEMGRNVSVQETLH